MELHCLPIPNHLLQSCRVFSNRDDIITHLSDGLVMAEVGVLAGDFSQLLLAKAKHLYLIDRYDATDWPHLNRFTPATHADYVKNRFKNEINVTMVQGHSTDMLATFDDQFFDVIYLDCDHSYQAIKQDLLMAYQKLKNGGLLWVNDYTTCDPWRHELYGVQKATNELINIYQLEVVYFTFNHSNFHDLCLKKVPFTINDTIDASCLRLYQTPYGSLFTLNNEEYINLQAGYWDGDLLQRILTYLSPQDVVIDVGAHIGTHTMAYATRWLVSMPMNHNYIFTKFSNIIFA